MASDEPFFFSQHRPFRGTAFAKWGPDAGKNEKALLRYPNAVAVFGHTHYTLTDDRTVLQKDYTAINAGALKNQAVDRHHENGILIPWIKEDVNRDLDMPCVPEGACQAGMVLRVSGDRIVLERRDFATGDRPSVSSTSAPLTAPFASRSRRVRAGDVSAPRSQPSRSFCVWHFDSL